MMRRYQIQLECKDVVKAKVAAHKIFMDAAKKFNLYDNTVIRLKPVQNQLVTILAISILRCCFRNKLSQRHLFKYVHAQNL